MKPMAKVAASRSALAEAPAVRLHVGPAPDARRLILSGAVVVGMLASFVYFSWWLDPSRRHSPLLLVCLVGAAGYTLSQVYAAWHLYLRIESPASAPVTPGLKVDVFVAVYDEPYELVERSLKAALAIDYPHRTYLLDDGPRPKLALLASRLGARYLARSGNDGAKAGNVNAALAQTEGEFVTVFDVDHVPTRDFLDTVLGHFGDPTVGFVQSWVGFHNQHETFVARAAAEQAYDPYGPTSMGMHGCGAAPVWGSHCTFRRRALMEICGHQTGLAEDLHTSLQLHAAGWQSVFVPTLSARGQVPTDLAGITKQHFKWARGVFELLLTVYPRLFHRLSRSQNAAYLVRLTYYLIGPVFLVHAVATAEVLLQGERAATAEFASYLMHLGPLAVSIVLVRQLTMRFWHCEVDARGLTWRGYVLSCSLWPVYTLALLSTLLRLPTPHIATPKERGGRRELPLALPQLALVGVLLGGIAARLTSTWAPADIVVMFFAALLSSVQCTAVYAAVRH